MFRKEMHATVDVGVVPLVVETDRINDHLRLLGRGCIVQVNQRPAANSLPEDGKVTADLLHIELRTGVAQARWTGLSGQSSYGGGHPISSQSLPVSSRRFSVDAPGAELAIWNRQQLISPKAGKRILAQSPQPWQVMPGGKLLELTEAFQVTFQLLS